MRGLTAIVALIALCVTMAHTWQATAMGATPSSRGFSYSVAAPKGWVIIHDTTFNGDRIVPVPLQMDAWINDMPFGGSGGYSGTIPGQPDARVEIKSRWIEWKTGKAFEAVLPVTHETGRGSLLLRFQRDGALLAYRRSDALHAGSLGRMATEADYVEIGRICAQPLPAEAAADLIQARADNLGIDFPTFDPNAFPDAGPSFCSGP